MLFGEKLANLKGNFRKRPFRVAVGLMVVCLWKLVVFWFHVMLAGGFVALVCLYMVQDAMPYMGFEFITAEAIERLRNFSVAAGFAAVFMALCFRVVMRLTLGEREPKMKKRTLWFFQDPSISDIGK